MLFATWMFILKPVAATAVIVATGLTCRRFTMWSLRNKQTWKALWETARGIWPDENDPIFVPFIPHNQQRYCEICEPGEEAKVAWEKKHGQPRLEGYMATFARLGNTRQYFEYGAQNAQAMIDTQKFRQQLEKQAIVDAKTAARARRPKLKCPSCNQLYRSGMTQNDIPGVAKFADDWYCTDCKRVWPEGALKKLGTCPHRATAPKGDECLSCKYGDREVV